MDTIPAIQGSYVLAARLHHQAMICIGALGPLQFGPGLYMYCGSARGPGGLRARIAHHLRSSPNPTWHIDYLKPYLRMEEVWILSSGEARECLLVEYLLRSDGAAQPVKHFGSSDCRSGCVSHLVHFPLDTKADEVFQLLSKEFSDLERIFLGK